MPTSEIRDFRSLEGLVRREVERADNFIDAEIGPKRAESLRYYRGEKFGNEEDGRSQVVWRVVRDAVRQILPSLMRVFFGSEKAVEYAPVGAEDVQAAEDATEYANMVVLQDNPGFGVFLDAWGDSLYQTTGVVKVLMDESVEVSYHDFTGLEAAGIGMVMREPGTELVSQTSRFRDEEMAGAMIAQGIEPPEVYDIRVKRTARQPRIRISAVPPEEFLVTPDTRSIEDVERYGAGSIHHKMYKTVGELVGLGYDRDLIEDHIASTSDAYSSETAYERQKRHGLVSHETNNPDSRRVLYVESWMRIDLDGEVDDDGFPLGDGISELRKFCSIGDDYRIVNGDGLGEPVSEIPFASFCPFPEPHLFFGEDVADQTKDLQLLLSNLVRTTLDSLSSTIFPRAVVVEGRVNMADVLNTAVGEPIRADAPGMYQPMPVPSVAKEALPFIELVKSEADRRVGVHNMALEADALQSTTKAAVNAQVDAARQQIELIARAYAELGMKRFFGLLLRLIVAHPSPKMVRRDNEWVALDPSPWNANMDVRVNVGLGHGLTEDRLSALASGMQAQLKVMELYGPTNPFVTPQQLSHSIAKMYELAGFRDTGQFINPDAQLPPPPPPQPTPEQILAEVEREKTKARALERAAELEQKNRELYAKTMMDAAKLRAEGIDVDLDAIQRAFDADRMSDEPDVVENVAEPVAAE